MRQAAVAVAMALTGAGSALAHNPPPNNPPAAKVANDQFFDWSINATSSYVSSPFLTDSSAGSVNAFLKNQPAGAIRAIKILSPINNATANLIFNNPNYNVSYVFGDIEMTNALDKVKTLVKQVRFVNGQNNGAKTRSYNAFVGNFGFAPLPNDFTLPSQYQSKKGQHSFAGWSKGDFESSKLSLAMPELYPGSASYRNPAAGNSSAPNIRSALFTLPILRLSQVTVNAPSNVTIVPSIARFNNWANLALDSNRNASDGYKFVPGQSIPARFGLPAVSAANTTNQMLSRRDFAAEVAHMRLRGADSFIAFSGGVVGYTEEQKRLDAKAGWTEPHIDSIFKQSDAKILIGTDSDYSPPGSGGKDINGNIIVDGHEKSDESAGALFSGVYSLDLKKMDVLLSNMDDDDHSLTLPSKVAGFSLKTKTFDVDGGHHLLVEYKLTTSGLNKGWSLTVQQTPFLNLSNNRNEIGIPEPTTMSLAAVAAMFGVSRRRRRSPLPASPRKAAAGPTGLIGGNMPQGVFVS